MGHRYIPEIQIFYPFFLCLKVFGLFPIQFSKKYCKIGGNVCKKYLIYSITFGLVLLLLQASFIFENSVPNASGKYNKIICIAVNSLSTATIVIIFAKTVLNNTLPKKFLIIINECDVLFTQKCSKKENYIVLLKLIIPALFAMGLLVVRLLIFNRIPFMWILMYFLFLMYTNYYAMFVKMVTKRLHALNRNLQKITITLARTSKVIDVKKLKYFVKTDFFVVSKYVSETLGRQEVYPIGNVYYNLVVSCEIINSYFGSSLLILIETSINVLCSWPVILMTKTDEKTIKEKLLGINYLLLYLWLLIVLIESNNSLLQETRKTIKLFQKVGYYNNQIHDIKLLNSVHFSTDQLKLTIFERLSINRSFILVVKKIFYALLTSCIIVF